MQPGAQSGCGNEVQRVRLPIRAGKGDRAAPLALDQESPPCLEKRRFGGEQRSERAGDDLAVVTPEQAAGGAVGVEHEIVAGDQEAFVDQLEQREIYAGLCALGEVR